MTDALTWMLLDLVFLWGYINAFNSTRSACMDKLFSLYFNRRLLPDIEKTESRVLIFSIKSRGVDLCASEISGLNDMRRCFAPI